MTRYFRRDHTTIMHGLRSTERMLETDADWRGRYEAARAELAGEEPAGAP